MSISKKPLKVYRKAFTLLELFISIAIIALIACFLTIKSFDGIEKKRFTTSFQTLDNKIKLSHELALLQNNDQVLLLSNTKKGISFQSRPLFANTKQIQTDVFQGLFLSEEEPQPLRIHFSSTGKIYPEIKICIHSLNKKYKKEIYFQKYSNLFEMDKKLGEIPLHPDEII